VLFDEPAAELDAEGARTLWRLIRVLAKEGKGILLATSASTRYQRWPTGLCGSSRGRCAPSDTGPPPEAAACDAGLGTSVATVCGIANCPSLLP